MINNLTILRIAKRNLSAFTMPHRLNRILQVLFIFLMPGIILLVGSLVLAKPAELPQDDTIISEVAVIQNSNTRPDPTDQPDEILNVEPDEKLDMGSSETDSDTVSTFGSVKAEPAILLVTLDDNGTANTCAIFSENDNTSYRPTEAGYSPVPTNNPYEYDPIGAELEQVIAGDTSAYVQNASAEHLTQIAPNQYYKTPLELLAESGGEHLIPDVLKPSNQDNPAGLPQPTANYQPANQAVNTVQYHYNGDGHLVGKTVDGVRTDFALDIAGGLPEVIYTSDGNSYLHLPGVLMTENADGEIRYLLSDGLGSIRQAVDENGKVVASYDYDPYGNPIQSSGGDPYGYTGEWWENDVGLLHLRARWYSPETGTFLSRDPIESQPPYLYAQGNPINFTDPSGYISQSERDYIRYLHKLYIKDTTNRLNVPNLTNLSDNAFSAMITAKVLMEDATMFADQQPKGWQRQFGTIPPMFLRDWARDLAEQHVYGGEISWGPANIPLALAVPNLEWWEQNHTELGLDFEDLHTNYYDARDRNWLQRWFLGSEQTALVKELQSDSGSVEGTALAMLQSSHRARQYWETRPCERRDLSAYTIAFGVIHFREQDETIYNINKWASGGSQLVWTEAIADAGEALDLHLTIPQDYIPYTQEEKQRLDSIPR